jgi:hypothetical protein
MGESGAVVLVAVVPTWAAALFVFLDVM